MTLNESNSPKPKLRWYQFSLRTLLLFVLIAGMGFGLLGQRIQRIRSEIRATAELEKLGAEIGFYPQEEWKDILPIPDRWLWKCFGNSPVDSGLEHLEKLTSLEWLHLNDTQVTDAGIEKLQRALPKCRIYLNDCRYLGPSE